MLASSSAGGQPTSTTTTTTTAWCGRPRWGGVTGPCTIDSSGCALSPSYPGNYGNGQQCTFTLDPSSLVSPLESGPFSTEGCCDFLVVNGVGYSGARGPAGVVPSGPVSWRSDGGVVSSGFRLCFSFTCNYLTSTSTSTTLTSTTTSSTSVTVTVTTTPWCGRPRWGGVTGPCTIDSAGCALSPSYPGSYGSGEQCTFTVDPSKPVSALEPGPFSTEGCCDILVVNGVGYSGTQGPAGVVPTGAVSWRSDASVVSSGFRLCFSFTCNYLTSTSTSTTLTTTSTSATSTTSTVTTTPWCGRPRWGSVTGPCTIDSSGCALSGNYPGTYGNNEQCTFTVNASAPVSPLESGPFSTESCCDTLVVNGVGYRGTRGPAGVVPTGVVSWGSDGNVVFTGFRLCFSVTCNYLTSTSTSTTLTTTSTSATSTTSTVTTTPWCTRPRWGSVTGPCTIDSSGCALSANYPGNYGNNEQCTFTVNASAPVSPLEAGPFSTESCCDTLVVNGVGYRGTRGPAGVVPTGVVSWGSDGNVVSTGFRLCFSSICNYLTSTPTSSTLTSSTSSVTVTTTAWCGRPRWGGVTGPCTIDSSGCALSGNYPRSYGNNEQCTFTVDASSPISPLEAGPFSTESCCDAVVVNGVSYSGTQGPAGIVPLSGTMSWRSDGSTVSTGFRLCFSFRCNHLTSTLTSSTSSVTSTTLTTTTTPWCGRPRWGSVTGPCSIDSSGCALSPGYPGVYGNSQQCTFTPDTSSPVSPLEDGPFSTEACCDFLVVSGVSYSGTRGPAGAVPSGPVTWRTDGNTASSGFRLCFSFTCSYLTSTSTTLTSTTSSGTLATTTWASGRRLTSTTGPPIPTSSAPPPTTSASTETVTSTTLLLLVAPPDSSTGLSTGVVFGICMAVLGGSVGALGAAWMWRRSRRRTRVRGFAASSPPLFAVAPAPACAPAEPEPAVIGLPAYWAAMEQGGGPFWAHAIAKDTRDWGALSSILQTDHPAQLGTGRDVPSGLPPYNRMVLVGAWCVQNAEVWARYCAARAHVAATVREMRQKGLPVHTDKFRSTLESKVCQLADAHGSLLTGPSELYLLHGTSPANVHGIMCAGLRLGAGLFGHGAYFAEDAAKTDQYTSRGAPDDKDGKYPDLHPALWRPDYPHPGSEGDVLGSAQYVFLCRVVLGACLRTRDGVNCLDDPPTGRVFLTDEKRELVPIPGLGLGPAHYHHSLVAETGGKLVRFREVMVYHPEQIYPEFLLAYMRQQA